MAVKEFLHILLFVTLMALKVSAVPIYLHDCQDDGHTDDCELCEHVIHNQKTELSSPPQFQGFEIDSTPILHRHESDYEGVHTSTPINKLHFGRPPPNSKGLFI
jgi:hypothetical protein